MTYSKQTWQNLPSTDTPISAERLTHIEDGVYANSVAIAQNTQDIANLNITNSYGNFYDSSNVSLTAATEIPIPFDTTIFSDGISIVDGYKITFTKAGKYNIQFSSQLWNQANQSRTVTIWLSKNGITQSHWAPETATDVIVGASTEAERVVAAWNFFIDVAENDFFALMIVSSGSNVSIHGGNSLNNTPSSIPQIPSTILTAHKVG